MDDPTLPPAAAGAGSAPAQDSHRHSPALHTEEQMAYRRARRAVRALRGWYIHLIVYLGVNLLLWSRFIFFGSPAWVEGRHFHGPGWPFGPTVIWGIVVAVHGVFVWSRISRRGQDWEARKIREYMDRG